MIHLIRQTGSQTNPSSKMCLFQKLIHFMFHFLHFFFLFYFINSIFLTFYVSVVIKLFSLVLNSTNANWYPESFSCSVMLSFKEMFLKNMQKFWHSCLFFRWHDAWCNCKILQSISFHYLFLQMKLEVDRHQPARKSWHFLQTIRKNGNASGKDYRQRGV